MREKYLEISTQSISTSNFFWLLLTLVMKSWQHLIRPQTCLLTWGEEMNDTFERSPPLDAYIGTLGFSVMAYKNTLKAPGCSACSSLALLKGCFYQNSNSNINNERCLPPVQGWRPGNLRSGWHILAPVLLQETRKCYQELGQMGWQGDRQVGWEPGRLGHQSWLNWLALERVC